MVLRENRRQGQPTAEQGFSPFALSASVCHPCETHRPNLPPMPVKKLCATRGCAALTYTAHCAEHTKAVSQAANRRKHAHPRNKIYDSALWKKVRLLVLYRDGHQCEVCGNTEQLVVDHIIPVMECTDPYDTDNLRVLCLYHSGQRDGARATHGRNAA